MSMTIPLPLLSEEFGELWYESRHAVGAGIDTRPGGWDGLAVPSCDVGAGIGVSRGSIVEDRFCTLVGAKDCSYDGGALTAILKLVVRKSRRESEY